MADQNEAFFVSAVANATGLDARVVQAWVQKEGAYAPNGTGGFNYLNLRPYQGDPYSSVSSGGFEQFSSVQNAEAATIRRLKQPFASAILNAAKGRPTPRAEIAAIASTGWDAGHYGGTGGPGLVATFEQIYGSGSADSKWQGVEGNAADAGSVDITGSGGGPSVLGGVLSWEKQLASFLSFLVSYRFLEIVGGGALVLVGLLKLANEPSVFGTVARTATAPGRGFKEGYAGEE